MTLSILAVDDDELCLRLVERTLAAQGFEVEAVRSGVEALAALERRRPDVVILDITMPGMNGFEVLDRIKANPRLASIPVIMLTARADDADLIASYQSGADYYITKPLVASQLLNGVGLLLGRELPAAPRPTGPPATPPRRDRSRSR